MVLVELELFWSILITTLVSFAHEDEKSSKDQLKKSKQYCLLQGRKMIVICCCWVLFSEGRKWL